MSESYLSPSDLVPDEWKLVNLHYTRLVLKLPRGGSEVYLALVTNKVLEAL
jgi:hypothetical protein